MSSDNNDEIKDIQKQVLRIVKIFDSVCEKNNINYTLSSGSILGAIRHGGFIPWDGDMDVLVPINQFEFMREKMQEELKKYPDLKMYIWNKEKKYAEVVDRICPVGVPHEKIHLDIFPLIGAPDNKKEQKKFANICFYSYKLLRCKNCNTDFSKKDHITKIKILKIFMKVVPDRFMTKWYNYLQNKYDYEKSKYVYILASGYGVDEVLKKETYMNTIKVTFEDTELYIPKEYDFYLRHIYGENYMKPKKDGYKKIDQKKCK